MLIVDYCPQNVVGLQRNVSLLFPSSLGRIPALTISLSAVSGGSKFHKGQCSVRATLPQKSGIAFGSSQELLASILAPQGCPVAMYVTPSKLQLLSEIPFSSEGNECLPSFQRFCGLPLAWGKRKHSLKEKHKTTRMFSFLLTLRSHLTSLFLLGCLLRFLLNELDVGGGH